MSNILVQVVPLCSSKPGIQLIKLIILIQIIIPAAFKCFCQGTLMVCFLKCPKKKKNYVDRFSTLNIAQLAGGQSRELPVCSTRSGQPSLCSKIPAATGLTLFLPIHLLIFVTNTVGMKSLFQGQKCKLQFRNTPLVYFTAGVPQYNRYLMFYFLKKLHKNVTILS